MKLRLKWGAGTCFPDQTRTTVWRPPFTDPWILWLLSFAREGRRQNLVGEYVPFRVRPMLPDASPCSLSLSLSCTHCPCMPYQSPLHTRRVLGRIQCPVSSLRVCTCSPWSSQGDLRTRWRPPPRLRIKRQFQCVRLCTSIMKAQLREPCLGISIFIFSLFQIFVFPQNRQLSPPNRHFGSQTGT